ncbi:MAG: hypothetical protein JWP35_4044 [Caulobacter sp.]|nr:hypothetical protein [Caulobacter sp.]
MIGFILAAALAATGPAPSSASHKTADTPNKATPSADAGCSDANPCHAVGDIPIVDSKGRTAVMRSTGSIPWLKDGKLALLPGDVATLQMRRQPDGSVVPVIVSVARANLADTDKVVTANIEAMASQQPGPDNTYSMRGKVGSLNTAPDTLRITFRQAPGRPDSLLILEDGYHGWLRYRARMVMPDGRTQPTDVCDVHAPAFGVEHWPYPIVLIELSDLRLVEPELDAAGNPVMHCE